MTTLITAAKATRRRAVVERKWQDRKELWFPVVALPFVNDAYANTDVSLRVFDPSNKRNSRFFQLKSVPRFGNVLELKQFILERDEGET